MWLLAQAGYAPRITPERLDDAHRSAGELLTLLGVVPDASGCACSACGGVRQHLDHPDVSVDGPPPMQITDVVFYGEAPRPKPALAVARRTAPYSPAHLLSDVLAILQQRAYPFQLSSRRFTAAHAATRALLEVFALPVNPTCSCPSCGGPGVIMTDTDLIVASPQDADLPATASAQHPGDSDPPTVRP